MLIPPFYVKGRNKTKSLALTFLGQSGSENIFSSLHQGSSAIVIAPFEAYYSPQNKEKEYISLNIY
jgi:hypothetical protein